MTIIYNGNTDDSAISFSFGTPQLDVACSSNLALELSSWPYHRNFQDDQIISERERERERRFCGETKKNAKNRPTKRKEKKSLMTPAIKTPLSEKSRKGPFFFVMRWRSVTTKKKERPKKFGKKRKRNQSVGLPSNRVLFHRGKQSEKTLRSFFFFFKYFSLSLTL